MEYGAVTIQLPVNPEELTISRTANNNETEVVSLGSIVEIGEFGLKKFSIKSFLPAWHKRNEPYVEKGDFLPPRAVINWIAQFNNLKKPFRFILGGSDIIVNMLVTVESFDYTKQAGDTEDTYYELNLVEWVDYSPKTVTVNSGGTTNNNKPSTNQKITQGSIVIVNGRLHRDSYGSAPGVTERNARRKINFIEPSRPYPYHVTLLDGGWRGWVTADSVRLA